MVAALFAGASAQELAPPPKKLGHALVADLRARLLVQFHGSAAARFTDIPGFGMDRVLVLYKEIPYERPDVSGGDEAEETTPRKLPMRMVEALEFTRGAFPDARVRPRTGPRDTGIMGRNYNNVVRTGQLQLRHFDLVSLIDRDHPKVIEGGEAFEIVRMPFKSGKSPSAEELRNLENPQTNPGPAPVKSREADKLHVRNLDAFEAAGVSELLGGAETYVRSKGNATRMLGALRATKQCLECHENRKTGDLLGAFAYSFVDLTPEARKLGAPGSSPAP